MLKRYLACICELSSLILPRLQQLSVFGLAHMENTGLKLIQTFADKYLVH